MSWDIHPLISHEELEIAIEWKVGSLFGYFCSSFDNVRKYLFNFSSKN